MKQFRLSVFSQGAFLSYDITTEDDAVFRFALHSAPDGVLNAPATFRVSRDGETWRFDPDLDASFKKSVVHTLKRANV